MKLLTKIGLSIFPMPVLELLQTEWPLTKLRWRNKWFAGRVARQEKLRQLRDTSLHLGCGKRITEGWLNIDCFSAPGVDFECDFREPLPFGDSTAKRIYSEHVLEHLHFPEAQMLLRECYRTLQPGGA